MSANLAVAIHRNVLTQGVLKDVERERERQQEKWGTQRHDFTVWQTVLSEEVGELAKEILDFRVWIHKIEQGYADPMRITEDDQALLRAVQTIDRRESFAALNRMREEAVQVAAVAVAMIEHIDDIRTGENAA